jgi:dTDP-4-amino-4,6-dideoxygalactose transaminase
MTLDILLSPPDVGELEEQYVVAALRSGWVAPAGPDLTAFEEEMRGRVGRDHAVAVSSGTAGLHLALVSWGVGPGDVVLVPTFTFAATVNAVRYVGATPHFVDCDPTTGNVDPALLVRALDDVADAGGKVSAVVAVDMFGKCADYTAIRQLCASRGLPLLSDAAESLGSVHGGVPAGAHGDAAVLSFNGNKVMTTSGGGMLLTDDQRLADHVRKLSTQAREPVAHYEHHEIGYNYRLSNLLAALGRAQLQRLDEMIERRRGWRARYRSLFAHAPGVHLLGGEGDASDNCWLTAVVVDPRESSWTAQELAEALTGAGIESRPVWKPMHLQPVHAGWPATLNGSAELLFEQGLTLPSGSAMTDEQFERVADVIEHKVLSR